jgi:hypothetical protein
MRLDELAEPRPLDEERLVGNFDRRRPSLEFAVEGDQPVPGQVLEHVSRCDRVHALQRGQITDRQPVSYDAIPIAKSGQPQEQLRRNRLLLVVPAKSQLFGPPGQGAAQASDGTVVGQA